MIDLASKLDYNICMNWKKIRSKIEVARWKWCCTTKLGRKWSMLNQQDKFVAKLFLINGTMAATLIILGSA
jgi:hypothetical protein